MSSPADTVRRPRDLSSGSLPQNLFRMAWPLAAGQALQVVYNLVDAFWLGRYDHEFNASTLGAPGVAMAFGFVVVAFGMGFGNAGTALVAQHTGAGRHGEASRAAAQAMGLLCMLAAALALPVVIWAPGLLRLAQTPREVFPHAVTYIRITLAALPAVMLWIGYASVLRALGDTVTVLIVGAAANLLNFVLDPVLILWLKMGAAGAATATVLAQVCGVAACLVLLRRGHAGLHVHRSDFKPDWAVVRKVLRIGVPGAIGNSATSVGFALYQVMVNRLGVTVVEAVTIGFRVISLFGIPAQSMAMAAAPVVGQALGAGKPQLARRAVWVSVALIAVGMLLPYGFLMWQGSLVAGIFVKKPEVIRETDLLFRWISASSYFFGVTWVLTAAFWGSGHTRPTMILAFVRLWLVRLPVAYLLAFVLVWGSRGIYVGMLVGNVVSAAMAYWMFRFVNWQRAVVAPAAEAPPED
jgi:putative MATE family efflux protein